MSWDPRIADAFARLPDYLGGHVLVSMTALALGLAVSLPLAIFSMRRPGLRRVLLGFAGVVQTIPGLALLALFYPLLLALAALTRTNVRRKLLRARIPAGGDRARALQHAAGAAEHHHRPAGHRSGGGRGRARRRHDAAAIAARWWSCRSRCR